MDSLPDGVDGTTRCQLILRPAVVERLGADDPPQNLPARSDHRIPGVVQSHEHRPRDLKLADAVLVPAHLRGQVVQVLRRHTGTDEKVNDLLLAAIQQRNGVDRVLQKLRRVVPCVRWCRRRHVPSVELDRVPKLATG